MTGTEPRAAEAGFTLIEALVAMAVLAVGAVSLLSATEGHSRRTREITDRTVARWVADDRLSELRLGLSGPDRVERFGAEWLVTQDIGETADPDLESVAVGAGPAGDGRSGVIVTVTGYRDAAIGR